MPDADRQIAMDVETEPFAPSARSPLADTWVHFYLFLLHLICLFVFLFWKQTHGDLSTCNRHHSVDDACNICQPILNKTNKEKLLNFEWLLYDCFVIRDCDSNLKGKPSLA